MLKRGVIHTNRDFRTQTTQERATDPRYAGFGLEPRHVGWSEAETRYGSVDEFQRY